MSSQIASSSDLNRASLGKTLAGEKPKAARTLLYGRGSRLVPRSPGEGEDEGAMNPPMLSSRMPQMSSEQPRLQRSVVRGKSRAQSPKCRRLAKPKCRGRKKTQITHRKWRPEAMSRAREAPCR
ncbi:Uncharacterized protein HZ326_27455 [Fusarium oxysporum f. sp. albedinis]|nr:Uncharacterized protein HZ326_27455 [Fusarium oxysporum f. sp. albedinis]